MVYNPLDYARVPYENYLGQFAQGGRKRILFLGMNPGPWGMVQTGIAFGEVAAVRDWLGISGVVGKPPVEHPKRPVDGFSCVKSEVSGRRLWGLFKDKFATPGAFFKEHFVLNYCPLAFMSKTGANITPDKLPAAEARDLFALCDAYLSVFIEELAPEYLIGIGQFAQDRLTPFSEKNRKISRILHPSPASPAANRDWAGTATRQLVDCGAWIS